MRSSPCDLSVIWDRSRSDPLDIPAFPNGLYVFALVLSFRVTWAGLRSRSESDATMAPLLCERMGKLSLLQSGQPRAVGSHLSRVCEASYRRTEYTQQHLLAFTEFLRRFRTVVRRKKEEGLDLCAFCRNNGEPFAVYITHKVRDANGRVTCPVLRLLSCPLCKSTGDLAHTIKYCPYKKHLPP
ncbi:hypothetical protein AHF37_06973 [Paragonimus kellicotti]|nr:hypothetical protein AHF37_06973 [Paragonimus kellicotti]